MHLIYGFSLIVLLLLPFFVVKYFKTKKIQFLFFLIAGILMILSNLVSASVGTIMMYISYSILIIGVFINLLPQASTRPLTKRRKFFDDQFNGISQIIVGILAIVYGILSFKGNKLFPLSMIILGVGAIIGAIFSLRKAKKRKRGEAEL